jgi:hypothetical protein
MTVFVLEVEEGVETGEVGANDSALTLVLRPMLKLEGGRKVEGVTSLPSTSVVSLLPRLLLREGGSTETAGTANGLAFEKGMSVSEVEGPGGNVEVADRDEEALATEFVNEFRPAALLAASRRSSRSLLLNQSAQNWRGSKGRCRITSLFSSLRMLA